MKRSVPWESAIIIHTSDPINTVVQCHLALDSATENEDHRLSDLS